MNSKQTLQTRVDFLLADRRCYTYEAYITRQISQHFEKLGYAYQFIYLSEGTLQDYLYHIQHFSPAWTLGFVNLTPHHQPLCDIIRIPHFFWLSENFSHASHFLNSLYGKVGLTDLSLYQKLSTTKNIKFLPHGFEDQLVKDKKIFDVVLFADLIELSLLTQTWKELFLPEEINHIKKAVARKEPFEALPYYFYVDQYLKAQKTLEWISSFKEVRVDVFGEHAGNNWLIKLPDNVNLHTSLPFTEHLEVLKSSKIALMEPTSIWYAHAVAAGCLPFSANELEVKFYLSHPLERNKIIEKLKLPLLSQTWEKQTKNLINFMSQ